ncbi:MAG TPA: hypothetical protein PKL73_16730 [Polyangiaceae bacterium]|nr:hypothetical protein [Polyangiaceae bacterium]HNZ25476.1 hypothetical protein [Polyangiaceae bacterium]HOD25203.1 hypothetical protein [Polyangiaceae bacterium]HOE51793.1 hypothetical protein [Polyangiaceae bacterium]HOH03696.1 hypothetical protein [Polyangiaceae bacterium]
MFDISEYDAVAFSIVTEISLCILKGRDFFTLALTPVVAKKDIDHAPSEPSLAEVSCTYARK